MPTLRNRGERADENIWFGKRTARQTAIASVFVSALLSVTAGLAIELTEPAGAAHGYPGWMDMNGKKLADGEFRQWMQNGRLHIVITYKFPDGKLFEEHARFRQQPELMQEQWSWKEFRGGKPQREFAADFLAGTASAHIRKENETKDVSEKIDIDMGRTFAGFGFAIALGNLRKRLVNGERIELKAVGFTPKPLLRPQVVTVKIWYSGLEQMKMSGRLLRGDNFVIHPEIPAIAKLFIHVPDTHIWLTNPPPAGFLRWEGPIVLPTDPLLRVDLVSGSVSGPAEPVKASNHP